MKTKRIILIFSSIGLLALIIFKLVVNKNQTDNKKEKAISKSEMSVKTIVLEKSIASSSILFSGQFEAYKESKVSADIQGKISQMLVEPGDVVSKDQGLIQLDAQLLQLQLQNVEVQIEGLKADVNRYTTLTKADAVQGVQLEKSELALKSAYIQKATLIEQIKRATIRAPFKGVVTSKLTEAGAFAAPGIPLMQISDLQTLQFSIQVPEHDLPKFKLHTKHPIYPDLYPDQSLIGEVTFIAGKSSPSNLFSVQLTLQNTAYPQLKSGMFGKVKIEDLPVSEGIYIPVASIILNKERSKVYIIKNGKAKSMEVKVRTAPNQQYQVISGISIGDTLITEGLGNINEGESVITQ